MAGKTGGNSEDGNMVATLKQRHMVMQTPVMTASDIVFGGEDGLSVYSDTGSEASPSGSKSSAVDSKKQKQQSPPPPSPSPPVSLPLQPVLPDARCTLTAENKGHNPQLLSFQQECVQATSSSKIGHTEYKMWDNVAEPPDALSSPLVDIPYTSQQKHSLRSLLTSTYARSKYMMHASGSRQVSLLQGKKVFEKRRTRKPTCISFCVSTVIAVILCVVLFLDVFVLYTVCLI